MAPLIALIPLITAGIGVGTAIASSSSGNQPKPPVAPSAPAVNTKLAASQQAAALAQANALTHRRGMASTTLTSPMGTSTGPSQALIPTLGT